MTVSYFLTGKRVFILELGIKRGRGENNQIVWTVNDDNNNNNIFYSN